jgi:hypothetical protein
LVLSFMLSYQAWLSEGMAVTGSGVRSCR